MNLKRIKTYSILLVCVLATMPVAAHATGNAGTAIQDQITTGAGSLWNILRAIVLPIGALAFGWNAFKVFFGGEHAMDSAKRNMLTIVIVIAIVLLAPLVINQVASWFQGIADWQFNTN